MKVAHGNDYINSCKLVNLELHQEEETHQYYLTATYHYKQGPHTIERVFPHLYLQLYNIPDMRIEMRGNFHQEGWLDMGFGELPMNNRFNSDENFWTDTIIHTEVQEMTLEEVE